MASEEAQLKRQSDRLVGCTTQGLQTRRRENKKKQNKLNATPTTFSTKNNQF